MKFIDLFAGIGGFRLGLEKAGKHLPGVIYNPKGISPALVPAKRGGKAAMPIIVSGQTNGTSMLDKSTKNIGENVMEETSELFPQKKSQTMIYSALASLASHLASLERGRDLRTPEGLSFLRSLGLRETKDPDIYCSKTSKACLVTKREKLSRRYLGFLPIWGIDVNGRYLTASTLAFPKTGSGCSLSDVLEESVNQKYFLSPKAVQYLYRSFKRGRKSCHLPLLSQKITTKEFMDVEKLI